MNPEALKLVMERDELADLDPAERRLALRSLLSGSEGQAGLGADVADLIDDFGPLAPLMRQGTVTDVLVNGLGPVWVERGGELVRTDVAFESEEELTLFVQRLVTSAGNRVDVSQPIADARLTDGSRLHVVLPPIAPTGPLISIRRFSRDGFSLDELVELGMMKPSEGAELSSAVVERRSIVISGGTGTGKTTLMGALMALIPAAERVVLIEETPELHPRRGGHFVSLLARGPNVEGKGAIELAELARASLRMRPDRIVVGEVRGPEALVALEAMSTGHEGSMLTVHARSASEVVERLVALAVVATSCSEDTLRRRFRSAFDLAVHLERRGRQRVVATISSL